MNKFQINYLDLNVDYTDSGKFRSYSLDTHGNGLQDMMLNATIEVIDQDGDTLDTLVLDDCPKQVYTQAVLAIVDAYLIQSK